MKKPSYRKRVIHLKKVSTSCFVYYYCTKDAWVHFKSEIVSISQAFGFHLSPLLPPLHGLQVYTI